MGHQISQCECSESIPELQNQTQFVSFSNFDALNNHKMEQKTIQKFQEKYYSPTNLEETRKVSNFDYNDKQSTIKSKILITVIASATLPDNSTLEIQFDNQQAQTIYFGCKYKNKKNGQRINHIKIPCIDKKLSEKNRGQHFYIKYDNQRQQYRIKDLGIGFGVFTQVQSIKLQNNTLINVGSMYFTTQICYGQELLQLPIFNNLYDVKEFIVCGFPCDRQQFLKQDRNQSYLRLHCYGGQANDDIFILSSKNFLPVVIGRNFDCLIRYFDDNLLSKYQCTILFDGDWKLIDGVQGKNSTNGTWIYIKDEIDIVNNMMIKTNNTIFQITSL